MKQLTCEMCGSNDLLKQDGVFVCQTCGTKYSVEEAKKMMVEGTVEVAGTVKVDNTASIENYLKIAKTAYSSQNQAEAENYANKVIEIAPDNYEAWLIKGKAAGWQSTLANPRFPECVSAFSAALSNTPDDQRDTVIEEIKEEITNISCALISLRAERFIKWPDAEESTGFISDITTILKTVTAFLVKGISISISDIMSPAAEMINKSVINAYKSTIYPDYKSKEYPYPNDRDFSKYIERLDYCIQLVEQSIKLCDDDSESDIQRYKNLIDLQEYAINACSYDWQHPTARLDSSNASYWRKQGYDVDIYNNRIYFVKSVLTDSAKSHRRSKISEYKSKISAIESEIDRKIKAEKKKKLDEFWSKHSEEHKALTQELKKANKKRDELTKAQKGYSKVKLLDKHIAEITVILEEDRNPTSQLKKSEKDFIKNCELFWNNLSSNDGYDAYLNKYPILKKAESLEETRRSLENRVKNIEYESGTVMPTGALVTLTLLSIFIFVCGIMLSLENDSLLVLGILLITIAFVLFCVIFVQIKKLNDISKIKKGLNNEVCEYNATIDIMLAVPKFTEQLSNDVSIKIPQKLQVNSRIHQATSQANNEKRAKVRKKVLVITGIAILAITAICIGLNFAKSRSQEKLREELSGQIIMRYEDDDSWSSKYGNYDYRYYTRFNDDGTVSFASDSKWTWDDEDEWKDPSEIYFYDSETYPYSIEGWYSKAVIVVKVNGGKQEKRYRLYKDDNGEYRMTSRH